jgi:hypothetical protein
MNDNPRIHARRTANRPGSQRSAQPKELGVFQPTTARPRAGSDGAIPWPVLHSRGRGYVFSFECGAVILVCPTPAGVRTFSRVSRSETTMVAVGLSPRTAAKHTIRRRGATTERSNGTVAFNRRSATRDHDILHPWTEVHGYHHGLAPRGARVRQSIWSTRCPALNTYERGGLRSIRTLMPDAHV